jgi:uncharacterized protein YidB (DUF937 family)
MGLFDGVIGGLVGGQQRQSADYGAASSRGVGADTIAQLAAKTGLSPQELLQKLAQTLPQAIDKLTPTGVVQNK